MSEPRYETWPVNVLVGQRAELRFVRDDRARSIHPEIEAPGEYRIDLGAVPFERIAFDAGLYSEDDDDFHVAGRIEDGEIVLWLERKPVKQQPVGPPIEAEQAKHACPGGCGHLVARSVISGARACPVCGFQEGERA